MDRYRKMSYITGYLPVEYEPKNIIEDMAKAGMGEALTEDEIKNFIDDAKKRSSVIVMKKIKDGNTILDIMQWCMISPDCMIPICNSHCNVSNTGNVTLGYFNYEIKRILENEILETVRHFRKNEGQDYVVGHVLAKMESENLIDACRETGLEVNQERIKSMLAEQERSSIMKIVEHTLALWSAPKIMGTCENDPEIVFGHGELLSIVPEIIKREHFRVIGKHVIKMKNSEITTLILAAEKMRFLKMIRSDTGLDTGSKTDMGSYTSEYMQHMAALDEDDLSELVEIMRAYLNWKGMFNFVQSQSSVLSRVELADLIIKGFAENNGIKGELLQTFIVSDD